MKSGRGIVEIFGRCSRLLNKIALNAEDNFFSQLCIKESDKLLSEFIFFLEKRRGDGTLLGHVAQSGSRLISRIKKILNLLEILKYLNLTKLLTSLLLERDLLLLKLSIMGVFKQEVFFNKREKPTSSEPPKSSTPTFHLSQLHEEILGFVKNKDKVQNTDVFSQFAHISRRTMKRKLSELVKTSAIKRATEGKKVFYLPVQI